MSAKKLAQNGYRESILKMLQEVCQQKLTITIWKVGLDRQWQAKAKVKIIRSASNELLLIAENGNEEEVKKMINGEKMLRFYIEDKNTLFQANLRSFHYPEIIIEIPKFMAIQDRRKFMRLNNDEDRNVVLFHGNVGNSNRNMKRVEKKLQDFSAGGLSFIMGLQEQDTLKLKDYLFPALMWVGGKEIKVLMKLVNLIELSPNEHNGLMYKGFKACFNFNEISNEDKEYLNEYVLKHYKLAG